MPSSPILSIRLPEDLRREVDAIADWEKRSRSFIVKEAVTAYVAERRAYREAIAEGIADLEAGRVVSGEEFSRWVASLGTDHELPAPEPPKGGKD